MRCCPTALDPRERPSVASSTIGGSRLRGVEAGPVGRAPDGSASDARTSFAGAGGRGPPDLRSPWSAPVARRRHRRAPSTAGAFAGRSRRSGSCRLASPGTSRGRRSRSVPRPSGRRPGTSPGRTMPSCAPGGRPSPTTTDAISARRRSAFVSAPCRIRVPEQDDELVTAIAARDVGAAHVSPHGVGDRPQEVVARLVAQLIVDRLEVVQVEHEHRERAPRSIRATDLSLDGIDDPRAIGSPVSASTRLRLEGCLTCAPLLACDDGREVGEQRQDHEVERERRHGVDRSRHAVFESTTTASAKDEPASTREHQRRDLVERQRRAGDDEQEPDEERTVGTAGQSRQQRQEHGGGDRLEPVAGSTGP